MSRTLLTRWAACTAVLAFAFVTGAFAQSTEEVRSTEQQLEAIKNQIAADEQRLERTRTEEQAGRRRLDQATRDIRLREELVTTYDVRVQEMETEIDSVFTDLQDLKERVEALTTEYGERVRSAYRRGRMSDAALVLAAGSVNQMLVRIKYLRRFQDDRVRRRSTLGEAMNDLQERRRRLEETIRQTEEMRGQAVSEKRRLDGLRAERETVVAELRTRGATIERGLREKREAEQALRSRLRNLISASTARRETAANAVADAAFTALTGSFESNRGRLPWPAGGTVIEPYGWTADPVYGTRTLNPGVFVAAPGETDVRAIFEGTVEDVGIIAEYGRYVMIAHGDYVTVYGNLSSTSVTRGSRVQAGAAVGRTGTAAESRGSGYFFGLFKGEDFIDPAPWLSRR